MGNPNLGFSIIIIVIITVNSFTRMHTGRHPSSIIYRLPAILHCIFAEVDAALIKVSFLKSFLSLSQLALERSFLRVCTTQEKQVGMSVY